MKKIININSKISIWADKEQFIVQIAKKKEKESNKQRYENWYLPTLYACFDEIYKDLLKDKLTEKVSKDTEELKVIYERTKKEIKTLCKTV